MNVSRRKALQLSGLGGLSLTMSPLFMGFNAPEEMNTRTIPSSGEALPMVGLGTWQTFDVHNNQEDLKVLKQVLAEMSKLGGTVIDSSPMYGSSEAVVGRLTQSTEFKSAFFYATKVWTTGKQAGIDQMNASFEKMGRSSMDLMQIHNLVDWQTHIRTLRNWKEEGKIRYWGLTHYQDSAHATLEKIITQEKPDFVQLNYSIGSRHAEKSLFDTVQKQGTAVLINRPFESGRLFQKVKGKALPEWCQDYSIQSWGQYFLKFILSHNAVTCVIPGTSKPHHLIDNMGAGYGKLPDTATRKKMHTHLMSL